MTLRGLAGWVMVLGVSAGCGDDPEPRTEAGADGGSIGLDSAPSDARPDDGTPRDATLFDEGPPADWAACDVTSECVLSGNSCCGVCGAPSLANVDGVNRARSDEHFRDVCPMPIPCPTCPSALNPDLQVTCASSRCAPFDVRLSDVSLCTSDADCRLRVTQCCECGGDTSPFALIAVSSEPGYSTLVCDPMIGCPECAPTYPDTVRAVCAADGHCAVEGR